MLILTYVEHEIIELNSGDKYDLENKIFFLKSARITFKTLATGVSYLDLQFDKYILTYLVTFLLKKMLICMSG